jgi:hypothetical protein
VVLVVAVCEIVVKILALQEHQVKVTLVEMELTEVVAEVVQVLLVAITQQTQAVMVEMELHHLLQGHR